MHTHTMGATGRPKSIEYTVSCNPALAAMALQPTGLLSKENLRRLVAAMVD